ncbi:ankyrin repeat domain-containing protein [bacterium]|nr:ankyrin repeat domain-containing protein [bacterium]
MSKKFVLRVSVGLLVLTGAASAQIFPFGGPKSTRDRLYQKGFENSSSGKRNSPSPTTGSSNGAAAASQQPVHKAARGGLLDELKKLEASGQSLNLADSQSRTPLHMVSEKGHLDCVEYLLSCPSVLKEARDLQGNTPLLLAARSGQAAVVERLVKGGCDPNALAKDGSSALHYAAAEGSLTTVEALLAAGCDPRLENGAHKTALMLATEKQKGDSSVIITVLQKAIKENP